MVSDDAHPRGRATSAHDLGLRLFDAPPEGFDAIGASTDELERFGFPPRPDPESQFAEYELWKRVTSRTITRVIPEFGPTPVGSLPTETYPSGETSSNWSGSVLHPVVLTDSFNRVSASWTVTDIAVPGNRSGSFICSCWIGLDGWQSGGPGPVQIGTTQLIYNEIARFHLTYAWWEWVPDDPQTLTNIPVAGGDIMFATVRALSPVEAGFYLTNLTTGLSTSFAKPAPDGASIAGATADWIVEAPIGEVGGLPLELAPYASVYFDGCAASTRRGAGYGAGEGEKITMTDSGNYAISIPHFITNQVMRVDYA